MNSAQFRDKLTLQKAFTEIAKTDLKDYTREIAKLVADNNLNKDNIQIILSKYSIRSVNKIKVDLLDILITYANFVLEDHIITDDERRNFEFLKLYFEICEGDFYKYKRVEIKAIISKQFEKQYADNLITYNESESSVLLQDMFDLDYDQLDKMKEEFVIQAIERGAEITNLDTANKDILKEKSSINTLIHKAKHFFNKK